MALRIELRLALLGILVFAVLAIHLSFQLGQFAPQAVADKQNVKAARLDPFVDLHLRQEPAEYSQHRCKQQSIGEFPSFIGRTCLFRNLYFEPASGRFHYYASNTEASLEGDFSELVTADGYIHKDSLSSLAKLEKNVLKPGYLKFQPIVHANETLPTTAPLVTLEGNEHLVFLLYRMSYNFNFGHFLFDDVLGIFAMLEAFGMTDKQHVPLAVDNQVDPFYRCSISTRREKCVKPVKKFSRELLGIDYKEDQWLGTSNLFRNETLVRLPAIITGAGRSAHYSCQGDCTLHRNVYRAREWIFQNVFGKKQDHSTQPVTEPLITVSLPVGNTHKGIEHFESIIPALESKFQNVTVVNMAKLSIPDQLLLASKSAVYLTNHGGGSATSLFLQSGSTVLLFGDKNLKRDKDLYDSLGYLHTEWLVANKTEPQVVVLEVARALDRLGLRY